MLLKFRTDKGRDPTSESYSEDAGLLLQIRDDVFDSLGVSPDLLPDDFVRLASEQTDIYLSWVFVCGDQSLTGDFFATLASRTGHPCRSSTQRYRSSEDLQGWGSCGLKFKAPCSLLMCWPFLFYLPSVSVPDFLACHGVEDPSM